ncbi:unnamed protein product [Clavelina lepadiformis]
MGCNASSVSEVNEINREKVNKQFDPSSLAKTPMLNRSEIDDIGMTSVSNADLLDAQRLQSTDVTRGLEDRWIRSHFSDQVVSKNDTRSKRRQSSLVTCETACEYSASPQDDGQLLTHDSLLIAENADTSIPRYNGETENVQDRLCILHFNDVYEIAERKTEPVGGAARFAHLIKQQADKIKRETGERPLIVFGGDCLNPSTLSCATQGLHMIEVLNYLEVDVAVYGNHEFDFGVAHAAQCIAKMNSTWFLGNVTDKLTKRNLAEGKNKLMIERRNGFKVGFLGLVEEEWLDTLATVAKTDLDYQDYVSRGREIAKELREEGADFVVALTHMRWPNDVRLTQEVPDIDLVLGGHDHGYGVKEIDDCLIVKSGSDFRNFSTVDVLMRKEGCLDVRLTRHDVSKEVPEDRGMAQIVHRYTSALEKSLEARIGIVLTDLDGSFDVVRSQETRLGNFVADIMASVTKADLVLMNSGTFRSDGVHSRGDFRLRDLMTILPINDSVVVIVATGKQLLEALENGVSKYPKLEGRFPQVSGICFGYDPSAKPGHRVVQETILIGGKPLDLNKNYKIATKAYVARGKDGYTSLKECKILTDPDSGPLLSTIVRNHLTNVNRLIDFQESRDCKVSISMDGCSISCNKSNIDVKEAFKDGIAEAPIATLKNSLKSVISQSSSNGLIVPSDAAFSNDLHTPRHLPSFIAASKFVQANYGSSAHAKLRQDTLSSDQDNLKLLRERSNNPSEVRWQVLPLIEARIFPCASNV